MVADNEIAKNHSNKICDSSYVPNLLLLFLDFVRLL